MMLNTQGIDSTWRPIIEAAVSNLPEKALQSLAHSQTWLPGPDKIFNAFRLPLPKVRYVLVGESPYPRAQSAIGYAFWDGAVGSMWSPSGFSKPLNRATSLRHFVKMLLIADGALSPADLSQQAIASLDRSRYVETLSELFENMLDLGFLLLNASLTLSLDRPVREDVKWWQPLILQVLKVLAESPSPPILLIFGNHAKTITQHPEADGFKMVAAEHPYNHSFMTHSAILKFFKPLHLLEKKQ